MNHRLALGAVATGVATLGVTLASTAPVTAAPSATARCTVSDLSLGHTRHDLGAGQGYEKLVFTNRSGHTCRLSGFPGVSYVDSQGHQLTQPADRDGTAHTATLAPGASAKALLHWINNVGAVPACQGNYTTAAGLRVYPPGSSTAMYLRDPHPACRNRSAHLLDVHSVR